MQTSYWSYLTYPIWPTVGFLVPQNTRKTTCFVQFFFFFNFLCNYLSPAL